MSSEESVLSVEKVERYIGITSQALSKLKIAAPERSFNRKLADDFLGMARAYFEDSKDFLKKGDLINAFACVNYAHGWLDCGARVGLFDVNCDDRLFTLYE
ncbi:MAG: DUF357 domain-containing protein [Candidatus Thermoplasmatota archaeon]|nr:DUF357 domain-containing protein [Candidatus Thermoplasmatota archaeon]